jgi:hypothetical protein
MPSLTAMRRSRHLVLAMLFGASLYCAAQTDRRKVLSVGLAGGWAWSHVDADSNKVNTGGPALDLSFDYGISRRFALGFNFQRVALRRTSVPQSTAWGTSYALFLSYALLRSDRSMLLTQLGLGPALLAISVKPSPLPIDVQGGAMIIGAMYRRRLSSAFDAQIAALITTTGRARPTQQGASLVGIAGTGNSLGWSAQQLTAGLVLRF